MINSDEPSDIKWDGGSLEGALVGVDFATLVDGSAILGPGLSMIGRNDKLAFTPKTRDECLALLVALDCFQAHGNRKGERITVELYRALRDRATKKWDDYISSGNKNPYEVSGLPLKAGEDVHSQLKGVDKSSFAEKAREGDQTQVEKPLTWFEICEADERNNVEIAQLESQLNEMFQADLRPKDEGSYKLPKGFNDFPLLFRPFQVAFRVLGRELEFDEDLLLSKTQCTVGRSFQGLSSVNQGITPDSEAGKQRLKHVHTLLNFVRSLGYIVTPKDLTQSLADGLGGSWHAASIVVETQQERLYGQNAVRRCLRNADNARQAVVDAMGYCFGAGSEPEARMRVILVTEKLLRELTRRALKMRDEDRPKLKRNLNKVAWRVCKTMPQLAERFTRRHNVETKVKTGISPNGKPIFEKKTVTSFDHPLYTTARVPLALTERELLKSLNKALTDATPECAKQLQTHFKDEPCFSSIEQSVGRFMSVKYSLTDPINRLLKTRRRAVRNLIETKRVTKQNQSPNKVADKSPITQTEWIESENEFLLVPGTAETFLQSLRSVLRVPVSGNANMSLYIAELLNNEFSQILASADITRGDEYSPQDKEDESDSSVADSH